jgi:PST family polysaccharide transporter
VSLFRVLAPAAFVETFNTVGSWACMPFGRSGRLVRWQMFATAVMAVSFLVGARWGVLGVAWAVSLSTVALRIPSMIYLLRGSPVTPIDLLGALARPAGASLIAGAIVYALRASLLQPLHGLSLLVVAAPVFGVLYLILWIISPGGRRVIAELMTVREAAVS